MSEFFGYNSWNGSWHEVDDDHETGDLVIHTKQDVQASLDWAKKQRNNGLNDPGGKRDGSDLKHYATISLGQILAMRNEGIDIWDKNCTKDMIKFIEQKYPLCKVTNRKIL